MTTPFFIAEGDAPAKRTIMIEALRLFTRKGLCETTIRDIAQASGYTNPALYKHFASKDELALQLFIACYREGIRIIDLALDSSDCFEDRLRAFVRAYTFGFDAYPDAAMYAGEHLGKFWPDVPASLKQRTIITQIRDLIRSGQAEGVVPVADNVELKVVVVAGSIGQLGRLVYLKGLPGPAGQYADDLSATLLGALC